MFVPDEEVGGSEGTGRLVESKEFADLNVAFALDEGLANEQGLATSDGKSNDTDSDSNGQFTVFYGERAIWWLHVCAKGPTGHASRFVTRTAMEKLIACITDMLKYRAEQEAKLHGAGCKHASALKLGDVVTLNLTALQGGLTTDGKNYALNVVPSEAMAGFDIRIPPSVPLEEFSAILDGWASKHDVTWEYVQGVQTPAHHVTSIDPEKNVFWKTFSATAERIGMKLSTEIFPAATDGSFIRSKGIPVLGFSPMSKTRILLHDHNERLGVNTYMKGISLYEELIRDLANTPTPK